MPYVTRERRAELARGDRMENAGDLTFILTAEVERYRRTHGDRFQTFADIVGALVQAQDEFQRRVIHPYEADKLLMNGDCYAPPRRLRDHRCDETEGPCACGGWHSATGGTRGPTGGGA